MATAFFYLGASAFFSTVVTFLSLVPLSICARRPPRPLAAADGSDDAGAEDALLLWSCCLGGVLLAPPADDEGRSHVVTFVCGL